MLLLFFPVLVLILLRCLHTRSLPKRSEENENENDTCCFTEKKKERPRSLESTIKRLEIRENV